MVLLEISIEPVKKMVLGQELTQLAVKVRINLDIDILCTELSILSSDYRKVK